jgi:hypothetical protein
MNENGSEQRHVKRLSYVQGTNRKYCGYGMVAEEKTA